MRREEKKAILEVLDTIEEAQANLSYEALTACQEAAISIGNAIEKSEGEGTHSVALLEKFCEDLYVTGQGTGTPDLAADIREIRESIRTEIPIKLEVVFLPYKAQMWDSMESIYLAFKKRKDVNTWLVPIPYYNRKNDGTVESMHCEAGLFPKGEETTDWRAFDLSRIRPDIAFIHNPYDDANFVTTVDPMYYSWELKKNVDCLVYCPYYSTVGGMGAGQALCKAYQHVDYILAQSEYQVGFYDDSIPRSKFLIAGSPKFDRVIRFTKERKKDPTLFYSRFPEGWKEKCEGRRVYFYNTSLGGLLGDTPAFLDKMEYVFSVFAKQKDATLLWRPHPLFEDTLKALRPEYYDRYRDIRKKFIDGGTGILDETPDISLAVAISDAFIGDGGTSVTSLFGVTGKPVFLLNNNMMSDPTDPDVNDCFFNVPLLPEQDGYVVTEGNQIYKCDYPLQDPVKFHFVKRISEYSSQMYGACFRYGDDLYITPVCAEDVVVMHQDGSFSRIELRHTTDKSWTFFSSIQRGHYIFLIPNEYYYIVRLDLDTGEVRYTEDLRENFIYEDNNLVHRCGATVCFNGKLVIASLKDNRLLVIDVETLEHEVIRVGDVSDSGCMVMYSQKLAADSSAHIDDIWMLPYKGLTVRHIHLSTGHVEEYELPSDGFICSDPDQDNSPEDEMPFSSCIEDGDYLYIAPFRGNKFFALNTKTGKSHEWKFPLSIEWQGHDRFFTGTYRGIMFGSDNHYYWISGTRNRLYEVAVSPSECSIVKEIPVCFDVDELREHAYGFADLSPSVRYSLNEDAINPLSRFITGHVNGAQFSKEKQLEGFGKVAVNLDGTCGEKVCEFLMEQIYNHGTEDSYAAVITYK